jgi:hypothetical protein
MDLCIASSPCCCANLEHLNRTKRRGFCIRSAKRASLQHALRGNTGWRACAGFFIMKPLSPVQTAANL